MGKRSSGARRNSSPLARVRFCLVTACPRNVGRERGMGLRNQNVFAPPASRGLRGGAAGRGVGGKLEGQTWKDRPNCLPDARTVSTGAERNSSGPQKNSVSGYSFAEPADALCRRCRATAERWGTAFGGRSSVPEPAPSDLTFCRNLRFPHPPSGGDGDTRRPPVPAGGDNPLRLPPVLAAACSARQGDETRPRRPRSRPPPVVIGGSPSDPR